MVGRPFHCIRDEEAGRLGLALGKEGAEDAVIAAAPFAICAWRGRSSIAVRPGTPSSDAQSFVGHLPTAWLLIDHCL